MRKTGDLQAASKRLFHHQEIEYCYIIDAKGEQRQENLLAAHQKKPDPRLKPLQKPSDANWIRRPYFRKAIRTPHEIQVTRPYHSVADSMLCVTIAWAYHWHGELIVFCCDINWDAINVDNFNALIETKP